MWKAKIDFSKTRQNSDPAQPCKQERYHSYPENLLEPKWGWCIWQHYSPQTAWSWPFCSGSKEKTSSNWRTSPEETWLCQSSCGLDLGGLVLCFVDWWISLHSIRIWWQGLRETKATWGVQELLHSANCEVWWWWGNCLGRYVVQKDRSYEKDWRKPQFSGLHWHPWELRSTVCTSFGLWWQLLLYGWQCTMS